jgi:hypothetical protein
MQKPKASEFRPKLSPFLFLVLILYVFPEDRAAMKRERQQTKQNFNPGDNTKEALIKWLRADRKDEKKAAAEYRKYAEIARKLGLEEIAEELALIAMDEDNHYMKIASFLKKLSY